MEHNHNHSNSHGHSHAPVDMSNINKAFAIGIALNAIFTAIEFVMGYMYNSLALISDATHNLSDVASLILSLIGLKLAQKAVSVSYTYGYKKATILASLINAVMLIVVVVGITREAIERFSTPPEVEGLSIIIVALIGVLINTISAFLFFKGQKNDINIKGAFVHLLVDALVSVGVVVSGVVMYYTGWAMIDTIISLVIAAVILFSTWGLLFESVKLVIDAVPSSIKYDDVKKIFTDNPDVYDVHHIHIWAVSSTVNALTAHVVMDDNAKGDWLKLKKDLKHELSHQNIQHTTLELESNIDTCKEHVCC